jgi:hypothetical protein
MCLEVAMQVSRKEMKGGRAFAAPLVGVVLLIASYVILVQWQDLPRILEAAIAAVHWPA